MGDAESGQRLTEGAEGVEHRVGVEPVGAVGGGQQGAGVDGDTGLAQGTQQHRIQVRGRVDLEVDILAGVAAQAQRDRPHQHGGVDRLGAVLGEPGGLADPEMTGGQPDLLGMPLRDLADRPGMGSRVGQGADLADQGRQARRTMAGEQLGEPGRMGVRELEDGRAGPDLGEEGRRGDPAGDLLGPAVQGVGDQVLAAERAVLARLGGEVVLVLLGGDPGADFVEMRFDDQVVTARARGVRRALRSGSSALGAVAVKAPVRLVLGRLRGGARRGPTLTGQVRQGVVATARTLGRAGRALLAAQEIPHSASRYREAGICSRRRAVAARESWACLLTPPPHTSCRRTEVSSR